MVGKFVPHPINAVDIVPGTCMGNFFSQVFYMIIKEIIIVSYIHIVTPKVLGNGILR